MQIEIPCELYSRMAEIPIATDIEHLPKKTNCVLIERKNNLLFIIVTDVNIAAVECLGANDGPDEFTAIIVDRALIDQCEKETQYNSNLMIVSNPMLGFTSIKTSFGYNHPANGMASIAADNDILSWRDWFPKTMPTATNGAMYWSAHQIWRLATASKSGGIVFPEFIDASFPVLLMDAESSNWIGVFMPTKKGSSRNKPAHLPDWM